VAHGRAGTGARIPAYELRNGASPRPRRTNGRHRDRVSEARCGTLGGRRLYRHLGDDARSRCARAIRGGSRARHRHAGTQHVDGLPILSEDGLGPAGAVALALFEVATLVLVRSAAVDLRLASHHQRREMLPRSKSVRG
jgi:hypothetical protein